MTPGPNHLSLVPDSALPIDAQRERMRRGTTAARDETGLEARRSAGNYVNESNQRAAMQLAGLVGAAVIGILGARHYLAEDAEPIGTPQVVTAGDHVNSGNDIARELIGAKLNVEGKVLEWRDGYGPGDIRDIGEAAGNVAQGDGPWIEPGTQVSAQEMSDGSYQFELLADPNGDN